MKVIQSTAIAALMLACSFLASAAPYSAGNGSADEPYEINSVDDFLYISNDPDNWDMCFVLTANLDLSEHPFTRAPIAPDTSTSFNYQGTPFTGVFDGDNHIISNLAVTAPGNDYLGLFGNIAAAGLIKNLGVENANVLGRDFVGGLAGNNSGTIRNCHSIGSISGSRYVGGLIGDTITYNAPQSSDIADCYAKGEVTASILNVGGLSGTNWGNLSNCFADCTVLGNNSVGGLVGLNYGAITQCFAAGAVSGSENVGGLAGVNNRMGGIILNSFSTGNVSGSTRIGGLVGTNYDTITNCYAAGDVEGIIIVGGLAGELWGGAAFNACFWDIQSSGLTDGVGSLDPDPAGVTGTNTSLMQTLSTFTAAEWDFAGVWAICEGTDYPRLQWQIPAADWLCPYGVRLEDFARLAAWWLADNCAEFNNCDLTDLDRSGDFALRDLLILTELWLR
jgi:hypothetical protein